MNAHTAQQMLAAVADEVAADNDLPEESVQALLADQKSLDEFTADLIEIATKTNPDGTHQKAEDEAVAEFLRESHERIALSLKRLAAIA